MMEVQKKNENVCGMQSLKLPTSQLTQFRPQGASDTLHSGYLLPIILNISDTFLTLWFYSGCFLSLEFSPLPFMETVLQGRPQQPHLPCCFPFCPRRKYLPPLRAAALSCFLIPFLFSGSSPLKLFKRTCHASVCFFVIFVELEAILIIKLYSLAHPLPK